VKILTTEEERIMPFHLNSLALSAGAAGTSPGVGSSIPMIVMLVVMVAVFYFFIIRPENKKKKAAEQMRSSLQVGDEITTIGGIVGTVCAVKEKTIVMETSADRVRVEFTKWAISSKGTQASEEPAPAKEKKEDKKGGKSEKKSDK